MLPQFSSAAYSPSRPSQFIGSAADYRPIPASFCPTAADFCPLGPASSPLLIGTNGEQRIDTVVELGRPNTIYMSSGPSGPIFTFFIQFEFYPTKRSRFEKFSPPMLEFHLVFLQNFSRFFFQNFRISIQKICDF
jgi:hypothetical protein